MLQVQVPQVQVPAEGQPASTLRVLLATPPATIRLLVMLIGSRCAPPHRPCPWSLVRHQGQQVQAPQGQLPLTLPELPPVQLPPHRHLQEGAPQFQAARQPISRTATRDPAHRIT